MMACKNPNVPCPCCGTRPKHITRSGKLQAYCSECQRAKARPQQRAAYQRMMNGFRSCPPERVAERDTAYDAKARTFGLRSIPTYRPIPPDRDEELRAWVKARAAELEQQTHHSINQ